MLARCERYPSPKAPASPAGPCWPNSRELKSPGVCQGPWGIRSHRPRGPLGRMAREGDARRRERLPARDQGVLYAHPEVSDVQVYGVPDEKYGEQVADIIKKRGSSL